MRNWEIRARNRFCSGCGEPFAVGQVYHCLLHLGGEEPVRKDFCEDCWKAKKFSPGQRARKRAYWRATFKKLYQPVEDGPIKKDRAQQLLDTYIQSEQPDHINFCYLLALFQERKKVLIPRKFTRDPEGNKIIIYEQHESGKTYVIRDPDLSLSQAEQIQAQIKKLLNSEKDNHRSGGKD